MDDDMLNDEEMMGLMQHFSQDSAIQPGYIMHNSNIYSLAQWAFIKYMMRRRHIMGLRAMSISDERGIKKRTDPAAVFQYILGYGTVTAVVAIVLTVIAVIV